MSRDSKIDEFILTLVTPRWQKVAMVIAKVLRMSDDKGIETTDDAIAERIGALCVEGRLEFQGDISNWRHSELRKPSSGD
jgi:hypothetical protein